MSSMGHLQALHILTLHILKLHCDVLLPLGVPIKLLYLSMPQLLLQLAFTQTVKKFPSVMDVKSSLRCSQEFIFFKGGKHLLEYKVLLVYN